jgi:carboxypeptidase T
LWPWGVSKNPAPNHQGLQTLGRKLAYFNGYTPEQAIGLRPTSGTSNDFAYGELGVPAYTFELGTDFFQDCDSFTQKIIPENFPALLYAMKSSRAPYQLPSGPEIVGLEVAVNETSVTLSGTADDTRYNSKNGKERNQDISSAEYYLDTPPWVAGAVGVPLEIADGKFDEGLEELQTTLDLSELSRGQHIVYVRAKDSAGNWGVVSAVFVNIE